MKIDSQIQLIGNVYHAQVGPITLSPAETEKAERFGEPVIETGGAISGSATRTGDAEPTVVSFTLDSREMHLPSEFPVKQVFSLDDYADADVRATVWESTIRTRLTSARTTLLARTANFVGRTITEITS